MHSPPPTEHQLSESSRVKSLPGHMRDTELESRAFELLRHAGKTNLEPSGCGYVFCSAWYISYYCLRAGRKIRFFLLRHDGSDAGKKGENDGDIFLNFHL